MKPEDQYRRDIEERYARTLRAIDARQKLRDQGLRIKDWAEANGFNPRIVSGVLTGRTSCWYGEAHRVAVALGIKDISSKEVVNKR